MLKAFLILMLTMIISQPAFCADEWLKGRPAGTDLKSAWPAAEQANNNSLDRLLANYNTITLTYSSGSTIVASAGEVVCSNALGTIRKMRQNTSSTNVTFSDIDTGAEASNTTYYLYADCDADATVAIFKVSASASAPSGITYYKQLGYFTNDASSNISAIHNNNSSLNIGAPTSKTCGVVYQALTDGFVNSFSQINQDVTATLVSDSNSTPTTTLQAARGGLTQDGGQSIIPVSGFIKRGDYYEVTAAGSCTMYFTPLQ